MKATDLQDRLARLVPGETLLLPRTAVEQAFNSYPTSEERASPGIMTEGVRIFDDWQIRTEPPDLLPNFDPAHAGHDHVREYPVEAATRHDQYVSAGFARVA